MKRRGFIHGLGGLGVCAVAQAVAEKPAGETVREMAEAFLKEQGIRGLAVAVGREGRIEFEAGYGFADAEGGEPVTPGHRFRIASVSKPITAVAVMGCVERGLLKLEDTVLGPNGLLGNAYGGEVPEAVRAVTVDHLLQHTAGGWGNEKNDPMFKNKAMNQAELIAWTLAKEPLTHPPGTHHAYSNFGYCLLGRVLEKVTKQPYEAFVREQVLAKCGITSMKIGGNTLEGRGKGEVRYFSKPAGDAYGLNLPRMDAHGGWIAAAGDLVRFASQLPVVLKAETISTMTTPGINENYARGWCVNKFPNWWHTGGMPGTSTILVHSEAGLCWAGLLNGRVEGNALDQLMWRIRDVVQARGN